jgi:circadian clock protein KaiB
MRRDERREKRAPVELRLYVAGATPNSVLARANVMHVLEQLLVDGVKLTVLGVFERPDLAREDGVAVTPTLVRVRPEPKRRVVGVMNDCAAVLKLLDDDDGRST